MVAQGWLQVKFSKHTYFAFHNSILPQNEHSSDHIARQHPPPGHPDVVREAGRGHHEVANFEAANGSGGRNLFGGVNKSGDHAAGGNVPVADDAVARTAEGGFQDQADDHIILW